MTTSKSVNREKTVPETSVNEYTYTPKVDILETESSFNIVAEMPGVDRNGVNVKLEDGVLTILGRVQPVNFAGYEMAFSEYKVGNFERAFQISDDINEDEIQATMANGILTLVLPKQEAAKPKQIQVNVG
jgi:HSP20 family protein